MPKNIKCSSTERHCGVMNSWKNRHLYRCSFTSSDILVEKMERGKSRIYDKLRPSNVEDRWLYKYFNRSIRYNEVILAACFLAPCVLCRYNNRKSENCQVHGQNPKIPGLFHSLCHQMLAACARTKREPWVAS